MHISEILTHLGENREDYQNAVSPAIFQSSNFTFGSVEEMRQAMEKEFSHPFYTRGYNPTVAVLRQKLAALEKTEDALVFSSGSAAITAGIMNLLKAGDHIVSVNKPYSWTNKLLINYLSEYGVEYTFVDGRHIDNYRNAIRENTKLLFAESPNSMTFELQDLKALAALAKEKGIFSMCDNSYASPIYQNPAEYGFDLIAHSGTKYINGHSDVVAGVLCGSKKIIDSVFQKEYMTLGSIISPHDAWLMIRGLRTLEIRLRRSSESALKVAEFLEGHPKVDKIYFPFSRSHPQYALAQKQMRGCGGLMSIQLKTESIAEMEKFCNNLKTFLIAVSWGGYESLQYPVCTMYNSLSYSKSELPFNLVRLYIGLEDPGYLIADLKQALDQI